MNLFSQVRNGGWGAIMIYFYSLYVFLNWDIPLIISDRIAMMAAAAPSLAVMFLVAVANHQLNDFWAGGKLKESTETIRQITGENDFFESAPQEVKDSVDNYDQKAYGNHVAIIVGILLSILIPPTAYLAAGWTGLIIGLVASLISLRALSVRSYRELNKLAEQLSTPYEENYENQ
jgi:hypothetical protein